MKSLHITTTILLLLPVLAQAAATPLPHDQIFNLAIPISREVTESESVAESSTQPDEVKRRQFGDFLKGIAGDFAKKALGGLANKVTSGGKGESSPLRQIAGAAINQVADRVATKIGGGAANPANPTKLDPLKQIAGSVLAGVVDKAGAKLGQSNGALEQVAGQLLGSAADQIRQKTGAAAVGAGAGAAVGAGAAAENGATPPIAPVPNNQNAKDIAIATVPAPAPTPAAPAPVVQSANEGAAAKAEGNNNDNNAASTCAQSATAPNAATVALIKQFEGFEASPRPDPIGLPTVGFGHKCIQRGCAEVPFAFPLSQESATSLLATDAQKFVNCLHTSINKNVKLNDNQFGALTAFAFNLGCGAVRRSTMLRRLNAGQNPNAVIQQELIRFNRAGGRVLRGLTRRRNAEVALFQTRSNIAAHPIC